MPNQGGTTETLKKNGTQFLFPSQRGHVFASINENIYVSMKYVFTGIDHQGGFFVIRVEKTNFTGVSIFGVVITITIFIVVGWIAWKIIKRIFFFDWLHCWPKTATMMFANSIRCFLENYDREILLFSFDILYNANFLNFPEKISNWVLKARSTNWWKSIDCVLEKLVGAGIASVKKRFAIWRVFKKRPKEFV